MAHRPKKPRNQRRRNPRQRTQFRLPPGCGLHRSKYAWPIDKFTLHGWVNPAFTGPDKVKKARKLRVAVTNGDESPVVKSQSPYLNELDTVNYLDVPGILFLYTDASGNGTEIFIKRIEIALDDATGTFQALPKRRIFAGTLEDRLEAIKAKQDDPSTPPNHWTRNVTHYKVVRYRPTLSCVESDFDRLFTTKAKLNILKHHRRKFRQRERENKLNLNSAKELPAFPP